MTPAARPAPAKPATQPSAFPRLAAIDIGTNSIRLVVAEVQPDGTYRVLDEDRNVAYRSTFVVDREGVLRWGQAGDRQMVRDGREILRVLDLIGALRRPTSA